MPVPYRLYGDLRSGSAAVEIALAELAIPYEVEDVPLDRDAQLDARYRREVNPMGRVPALRLPDGTILTESVAILLTLADLHPDAALLPPPADPGRAKALRWMLLLAGEFYPHVTRNDYPERFSADPAHAPAIRARAVEMGHEVWRVLEAHAGLGDPAGPYLLGGRFSVADAHIAVMSRWMGAGAAPAGTGWMARECPGVERLATAVAARPIAGAVWARHFPADAAAATPGGA